MTVAAIREQGHAEVAGEPIHAVDAVATFYERRELAPMWEPEDAAAMLRAIDRSSDDGLEPSDYHRMVLQDVSAISPDLELLLTDAFLTLTTHLVRGRVDPASLMNDWCIPPRHFDLPFLLESALESHQIEEMIARLIPQHAPYLRLRDALEQYREMPDWDAVSPGPALKPGDRGPRVAQLRHRLGLPEGDEFDPVVDELLRAFQKRHGLTADAVAGAATLAELNVPRQKRIEQLILNLERWRWMPAAVPDRHIIVNIAAFQLEAYEDSNLALSLRTVVGTHYTRTPFLRSEVTSIIVNPYWNVPPSIAAKELYPKQARNPSFLASQHIEVLAGGRLRQTPGTWNALGRIKFDMPNRYMVYLHDTPARSLFSAESRAFSHGCIRVESPLRLAEWLLQGKIPTADIVAKIGSRRTETIRLTEPVRVYVLYWTAFVGADCTVQFRPDVYGRDEELAAALTVNR